MTTTRKSSNEDGFGTLLSTLLPAHIRCSEQHGTAYGNLFTSELASLGPNVVGARRKEFAAGRTCARNALAQMGILSTPILRGQQREPLWPEGVVGSITHCRDYCAAAVSSSEDQASIGIDAEPNEVLPIGVLDLVASPRERSFLSSTGTSEVCWDRLLFSIKESIYKIWYPLEQTWLSFNEVQVDVHRVSCTFQAAILRPTSKVPRLIHGRFLARNSVIITFASLPPTK